MDIFAKRHPVVIFAYYLIAFMIMLIIGHPVLFAITAGCMVFCRFLQVGGRLCLRSLFYSLGAIALCLIINPLCNHRGVTLLFTIGDMRITKEAVLYGGHMALLLVASIYMFSCFSYYMTAEKIMSLMGKHFPSFSMLFSMILRVVPKVKKDFREITQLHGNRPKVWSVLLGIEMEEAVERSIAMRQKKFGEKKRSHYWSTTMVWQDWFMVIVMCGMLVYLVWLRVAGIAYVRYFPSIQISHISWWQWCVYGGYMGIPIWLRGKEECKWFLWKQKITGSITHNKQNQPFFSNGGK